MDSVNRHMGYQSTFRGAAGDETNWVHSDQMEYAKSGRMGKDLLKAGVKCVVIGELSEEVSAPGFRSDRSFQRRKSWGGILSHVGSVLWQLDIRSSSRRTPAEYREVVQA